MRSPHRFSLYPEATSWWSFADYATVLTVMGRLTPKRVLEFGPGSSTLALIEGGAELVDCCEDDPVWFATYCTRLEDVYPAVHMRPYNLSALLSIPGVDNQRYDLALIDGPRETARRAAVVGYAMERCAHVLVPLECAGGSLIMRETVTHFARLYRRPVEWMEDTGPLAGAFALVGPPC